MGAVYKKELRSYFKNMIGCIVVAFMLLFIGIFSISLNFKNGYPNFEYSLSSLSFVLLFIVPVLTMRAVADERHQRTDTLLYSLPLSMTKIIMGKYFAMLTVFAVPTGVMLLYPLIMSLYGKVSLLTTFSAIFAFFLLGAALIAIGLFMSSLTESQVIAAVLSFGALLLCNLMSGLATMVPATAIASFIAFTLLVVAAALLVYYMTKNYWLSFIIAAVLELILVIFYVSDPSSFNGLFATFMTWLSLFERFDNFVYSGIFDMTAVVYYISVSAVFVFLTVRVMDKRRWS